MTVVVSNVGNADAVKDVVSESIESNAASKIGDARDGMAGVVLG